MEKGAAFTSSPPLFPFPPQFGCGGFTSREWEESERKDGMVGAFFEKDSAGTAGKRGGENAAKHVFSACSNIHKVLRMQESSLHSVQQHKALVSRTRMTNIPSVDKQTGMKRSFERKKGRKLQQISFDIGKPFLFWGSFKRKANEGEGSKSIKSIRIVVS